MEDVNLEKCIETDREARHIMDSLDTAMHNIRWDRHAPLSFHKRYSEAPNPSLSLSKSGVIALPLNAGVAKTIRSRGMGALIENGAWEMEAKEITLLNPKWDTFVAGVVQETCQALSLCTHVNEPRAELHKLLLNGKGSHLCPTTETWADGRTFGVIVIVLQSKFTGGDVSIRMHDQSYNCSTASQLDTSVMAWYTDVAPDTEPIKSGYCLALCYRLVSGTQPVSPAQLRSAVLAERVSDALLAWEHDDMRASPPKALCELQTRYNSAGRLSAAGLSDEDAATVATLRTLAEKHGFGIGLARLQVYLMGPAAADPYGHADFAEVHSREFTIQELVDLEGKLIVDDRDISFEPGEETIPAAMFDDVEIDEEWDEEDNGDDDGGYSDGVLERWFRSTVVVLWPSRNKLSVLYPGPDGLGRACGALEDLLENPPSAEEHALREFILANSSMVPSEAVRTLCDAGCRREDLSQWSRAATTCFSHSEMDDFAEWLCIDVAERTFGFEALRPTLEQILRQDARPNKARLRLLDDIITGKAQDSFLEQYGGPENRALRAYALMTSRAPGQTVLHVTSVRDPAAKPWARSQIREVLKTLRKPEMGECDALLDALHLHGGVATLQDDMLAPLLSEADSDFLAHFATKVHEDPGLSDSAVKTAVVGALLQAAIDKATLYSPAPKAHKPGPGVSSKAAPPADRTRAAENHIRLCFSLHHPELVEAVVQSALSDAGPGWIKLRDCILSVLAPLVPVVRTLSTAAAAPHAIAAAVRRICTAYADALEAQAAGAGLAAPEKRLAGWTCTCSLCARTKAFLLQKKGPLCVSWEGVGAAARQHVEGMLREHVRLCATAALFPSTSTGITVRKRGSLDALQSWRKKGQAMFKRISADDAELKQFLSTDYDRVMSKLLGTQAQQPVDSSNRHSEAALHPSPGIDVEAASPVLKKRKIMASG